MKNVFNQDSGWWPNNTKKNTMKMLKVTTSHNILVLFFHGFRVFHFFSYKRTKKKWIDSFCWNFFLLLRRSLFCSELCSFRHCWWIEKILFKMLRVGQRIEKRKNEKRARRMPKKIFKNQQVNSRITFGSIASERRYLSSKFK